jgi:hypothetical protein
LKWKALSCEDEFDVQSISKPEMFNKFNFKSLLKLIYGITKCSGLLFLSIDLTSARFAFKTSLTYVLASLILSIFAVTLDTQVDITEISRSELLNIGLILIMKLSVLSPLIFKFIYLFKGKTFVSILSNYERCHLKVCNNCVGLFVTSKRKSLI